MNATFDKKTGLLTITIPTQKARLSASGKTLIVATTNGFAKTGAEIDGRQVSVSVNAFIPKPE